MAAGTSTQSPAAKVRLDKWLWAARFYKTRSIAKQAIDGGKVHCDGTRAKPGKEVYVGLQITLRQGFDEKNRDRQGPVGTTSRGSRGTVLV